MVFKKFFVKTGTGEDDNKEILSFDKALMQAGVHQCNLVPVSSMLPRHATRVDFIDAKIEIGEMVFCVMSRIYGLQNEAIYAGLGYALGCDLETNEEYGFVLECISRQSEKDLVFHLQNGLEQMAKLRNFKIRNSELFTTGIDKISKNYACAVAVLIYRS